MHGQFTWYELTTPDVAAAQKFYPRFTGWGTQKFDNDYTMFTTAGMPVAGLFNLSAEMKAQGIPPNWMSYVETDNVDATAAQATSLGGKLLFGPQDVPGAGRFAVLQDPQGATFGIYKSATGSQGWDGTPVISRFSWHELMTTDYSKALEFYRKLFGWDKQSEMDMGGGMMYAIFGKGGKMYGGMFNQTPEMAGMHPFWLLYIHVKDVHKAVAAATKAGATVMRPPMDIPGGMIAILGDPQGAGFAVHHVTPAVAAPKAAEKPKAQATATATATAKVAVKPKAVAKASKPKARAKVATKKAKPAPKAAAKKAVKRKVASKPKAKPGAKRKSAAKRRAAPKKNSPARTRRPSKKSKARRRR